MTGPRLELPTISLVTPSYNQARYLEETMRSVFDQRYPRLEYIVVDGGSKDESVEVIRRHADRLAWWTSERDGGQYDAVNKGFARSTGEVMGWINSDDVLAPRALQTVGEIFGRFPEVDWLTTNVITIIDRDGWPKSVMRVDGYTREGFLRGDYLHGAGWRAVTFIQQESTFWRRSLWEKAGGGLDTRYRLAADFDLWARFFRHAHLYGVDMPIACFRSHGDQRSSLQFRQYVDEALQVFRAAGGKPRQPALSMARRIAGRKLPRGSAAMLGVSTPSRVVVRDVEAGEWQVRERGVRQIAFGLWPLEYPGRLTRALRAVKHLVRPGAP